MNCWILTSSQNSQVLYWIVQSLSKQNFIVIVSSSVEEVARKSKSNDVVIAINFLPFLLTHENFVYEMQNIKAKKILCALDDEYQLPLTAFYMRFFDCLMTTDIVSYYYFKRVGIPVRLTMHPVGPCFANENQSNYLYDVSFFGMVSNAKPSRKKILLALNEEFPNSFFPGLIGGHLPYAEILKIIAGTKVNLNFSLISDLNPYSIKDCWMKATRGAKGRPYEIGSQNGFCLSEYSPSLEYFLKDGVHIKYFETINNCVDIAKFYINNAADRLEISSNLNSLVLKDFNCDSNVTHFSKALGELLDESKLEINNLFALENFDFTAYSYYKFKGQLKERRLVLAIFTLVELANFAKEKYFSYCCKVMCELVFRATRALKFLIRS